MAGYYKRFMNPRGYQSGQGVYGPISYPRSWIITIMDDPIQGLMVMIVLMILVGAMAIGGVCIWPYFFTSAFSEGSFNAGSSFGKMIISGAVAGGLGLLAAFYLCWIREWQDARNFCLLRIFMIIYVIEMVACFIMIPVMGVDMLEASASGGWINVLRLLFHGMLGMLVPIVPSLLAALLGYAANEIWHAVNREWLIKRKWR